LTKVGWKDIDMSDNESFFARLFHAILIVKTDSILPQAIRFGMVGFVATFADLPTRWVLRDYAGFPIWLCVLIGYVFGNVVSYLLSVKWVFASRTLQNKTVEFTAFAIIGSIGCLLTEAVVNVLVHVFNVYHMYANVASIVLVFPWNYGARRMLIFRKRKLTPELNVSATD
jgi:putative flippase GtrA